MDFNELFLLFALSLIPLCFLILRPKKSKGTAPMVPGAWPVVGHLPMYRSVKPQAHVAFGAMADVYGPAFMTKIGSRNALVISSEEVAREVYTVHDKFLRRQDMIACEILGYDGLLPLVSPQGAYWREIRKIVISQLMSASVVDTLKGRRAGEVDVAFRDLYVRWEQHNGRPHQKGVLVDMKPEFINVATNMTVMMVAGKRYYGNSPNCEAGEARRIGKLILEAVQNFGRYSISDFIPYLGWLEWKEKKIMKRMAQELDCVFESWIEEHKNKRGESEKDYLDMVLESIEQHKILGSSDAHKTAKAVCLNMAISGSDAVVAILVWAVSLLVNNQHVLRKAQEELDRTIGNQRVVEESDLKDLVYLQAIVKETFRLYPPAPFVAYRETTEDFVIANGNFHIPAGTHVMVNEWKVQRDPTIWPNPEEFEPERFLTSHKEVDVGGKMNHKLFPFGLGRRACPASLLGTKMVQYILARFLHSFDVANPSNQNVDMTEDNNLVNLKATPLEVFITPRLHESLYLVDSNSENFSNKA
ncbi:cytochrome P450 CYP82D47 [Brassica rapa]|nr:cytochrome P450 CYP82D47 [Brassica rapa]